VFWFLCCSHCACMGSLDRSNQYNRRTQSQLLFQSDVHQSEATRDAVYKRIGLDCRATTDQVHPSGVQCACLSRKSVSFTGGMPCQRISFAKFSL
jgi:hypothetical protein